MTHPTIHMTVGVSIATLVMLPPLLRDWWRGHSLALRFRNWLLVAGALGFYAVIPSLLGRAGLSDSWIRSPWMNIFLFHPYVAGLKEGGGAVGPAMLIAWLTLPYLLLLAAIRRTGRLKTEDGRPADHRRKAEIKSVGRLRVLGD